MRTECIEIYKFDELSEEQKKLAIERYRSKGVDTHYIYDEAHETVKAFHDVFGTREGLSSWLDVRVGHFEDYIVELKGMRLRTYIVNNFVRVLFRPKYIGSIESNRIYDHPRIASKPLTNGNVFNPYYSGCQKDNSCVLTGVCYDHFLLQPIYDFLEWKNPKACESMDFEELIRDCFGALRKAVEEECDYQHSDEAITELLSINDYEFTEDGEMY